ncbi:MAG: hypothetical protein SWY16_24430 [Cyanobacteriota bacterium]|nr:hypothetical protein [Cyanobacteriota bacterium]
MISTQSQNQTIETTPDFPEFSTPQCAQPNPAAIATFEDTAIVPMEPLNPNQMIEVGGESAAIILSSALSIAVIILAVTELMKVLVPAIGQQPPVRHRGEENIESPTNESR